MKSERFLMQEAQPEIYATMLNFDHQLKNSILELGELLLIYIRASQINKCAFCIQMHIQEAIKNGEKQYRIHALLNWEESPFFTEEEQVILQMTEEITHISTQGLNEQLYQKAMVLFGAEKVGAITMAAVCINSWNRIARATLLTPIPSQV